jgi:cytochrome bd ubiquinol oxidase subunit I
MDTLLAARLQMEVSLAFHMFFAALGIGLPLLLVLAEGLWIRTGEEHYKRLARTWSKAVALTFAVGAVSGTALSFELGLLWPRFMEAAGGVLGPAFALEGYAFFIEAIFIGLYLYGWDRLSPIAHWWTGVAIAISGLMSGILVVAANAWMQTPVGIENVVLESAGAVGPIPLANALEVFRAPSWPQMAIHSSLSTFMATGFAVAGVYAVGLLRGRNNAYHRSGLILAMAVGGAAAVLQPISGDISARFVAEHQPAKLAAAEGHWETMAGAPLVIGGIPMADGEIILGLRIPKALSLLAHHDPNAVVTGLLDFPPDERPNVLITRTAFQIMVGIGFFLLAISVAFWLIYRRDRPGLVTRRWLLWGLVAASPLGYIALQAGWIVTEVGRQPWIIYQVMRVADGVTPAGGVPITLFGFTVLYLALGTALVVLLRALAGANNGPDGPDLGPGQGGTGSEVRHA